VTAREKIAFVLGVSNIFICGLMLGGHPYVVPGSQNLTYKAD